MDEKKMIEEAKAAGFDNAVIIDQKELVFREEFRKYCEENVCGNYGKNHACPPDCGTPLQMKEKTQKYRRALVLQSVSEVESIWNTEETKKAKIRHNQMARKVMEVYEKEGIRGLEILAGPCSICKECAKIKGEPCRFPEKAASCLSAYCIEAAAMAKSCGLTYWHGEEKVAYLSLFLLDGKTPASTDSEQEMSISGGCQSPSDKRSARMRRDSEMNDVG